MAQDSVSVALREMIVQILREEIGQGAAHADAMVSKYGELVSCKKAAKIINRSPQTVQNMVKDGRIKGNNLGISVRSLSEWIDSGSPTPRANYTMAEAKASRNFVRCIP